MILGIVSHVTAARNPAQEIEASARKLINAQGCKACHQLEGAGGSYATSLDEVRLNLTREVIRLKLVNPEHQHSNSRMPDFSHLGEEEIDILVTFLKRPENP